MNDQDADAPNDSTQHDSTQRDSSQHDSTEHNSVDQQTSGEIHADESPIMAKVVDDVREGSPFAVDPKTSASQVAAQQRKIEKFYDVGPLRYTAMGAVAASAMVIVFAAVACWWFPGGGALIAGLGCALAAFGLFSHMRMPAAGCLIVHLALFVISYSRILSNA